MSHILLSCGAVTNYHNLGSSNQTNKNSSPTVLCRLVRNQGVRREVLPLEALRDHLLTLAHSSFWWLPALLGLCLHHSNLSPRLHSLLFWRLACVWITLISVSMVTLPSLLVLGFYLHHPNFCLSVVTLPSLLGECQCSPCLSLTRTWEVLIQCISDGI